MPKLEEYRTQETAEQAVADHDRRELHACAMLAPAVDDCETAEYRVCMSKMEASVLVCTVYDR